MSCTSAACIHESGTLSPCLLALASPPPPLPPPLPPPPGRPPALKHHRQNQQHQDCSSPVDAAAVQRCACGVFFVQHRPASTSTAQYYNSLPPIYGYACDSSQLFVPRVLAEYLGKVGRYLTTFLTDTLNNERYLQAAYIFAMPMPRHLQLVTLVPWVAVWPPRAYRHEITTAGQC